jgi:hypothetical protein
LLGKSSSPLAKRKNKDHFLALAAIIRESYLELFGECHVFTSTPALAGDEEDL